MEDTHRRAIQKNLQALVQGTNYARLVDFLKNYDDKNSFIPENWMRQWLGRPKIPGWSLERINTAFYDEIQKRGPAAFDLLITALTNTGHLELAHLLDPSLSDEASSDLPIPQAKYDERGENCLFIDESWKEELCKYDRDVIRNMFLNFGFILKTELPEDNVASCMVVNFHKFSNDGVVHRDEQWIHTHFLHKAFYNKPKILISLRYKTGSCSRRIETDSGFGRHPRAPYNDTMWIKIYPNGDDKDGVSRTVREFVQICTLNTTFDLPRLMKKLTQRLKDIQDPEPVEVERWGFGKDFFLNKKS